ncbi:MAG: class I SAM-dependent methyltransferase [Clostridiales bacterium]|nr:class I SAM-dependent methyltransferase [Clostridiales bacterium]
MQTEKVAAYFNQLAPEWDTLHRHDNSKIERILNYADIKNNISVLDVGCGTGVLFPFYLNRDVGSLTGVDLSSGMIEKAKEKFTDPRITLIVGDAEQLQLDTFDRCVIYSALPHFKDAAKLIEKLSQALNPDGRLTVAHSESRELIDQRHKSSASDVSVGLMPATELAMLFSPFFQVDFVIDDDIYVVSGKKI